MGQYGSIKSNSQLIESSSRHSGCMGDSIQGLIMLTLEKKWSWPHRTFFEREGHGKTNPNVSSLSGRRQKFPYTDCAPIHASLVKLDSSSQFDICPKVHWYDGMTQHIYNTI